MAELILTNTPKGLPGNYYQSYVVAEDHLNDLIGVQGHKIYNKMRRANAQVRKNLSGVNAPILSANWYIEAASTEKKDIIAASLMERILFKDAKFNSILREILTMLAHGHSVFEPIYENRQSKEFGPYTTLKSFGFRKAETLTEWKFDHKTGELLTIHQEQQGDVPIDVEIDAKNLLIFFNEREGSDTGTSLLRAVYGAYKRSEMLETIKMIGAEKFAIPTPKIGVPSTIKPTSIEYIEAKKTVKRFTTGKDQSFFYPKDWDVELYNNSTFDPMLLEGSIKREHEKMSGAFAQGFLELGTGGNAGSLSLGDNIKEYYLNSLLSIGNNISDTINAELLPALMKLNFGDEYEVLPKLKYSGIKDENGEEVMRIITGYVDKGVIVSDEPLEDYVRKIHGLPAKAEGSMLENQEAEGDQGNEDSADQNDNPDNGDNADNPNAGDSNNSKEDLQLRDNVIQLADTSPPVKLIDEQAELISNAIKSNLGFISEKLIADIMNRYRKISGRTQRLDAIKGIKLGGVARYTRQMRGILTGAAVKALAQVKAETPSLQNIKLSDNPQMQEYLDSFGIIKFADDGFSTLPPHVKKLIALQATKFTEQQALDLENTVTFAYMAKSNSIDSETMVQKRMEDAAADFIDKKAANAAAVTLSSTLVNQTRLEFYFAPEVKDQIAGFKFNNSDPKTEICRRMSGDGAGKIYSANDAEFLSLMPPLHYNCKSYPSAVLKIDGITEFEPVPPLSKSARDSINLTDAIKFLGLVNL